MEDWMADLQSGRIDAAWERFVDRHRKTIFAAIRRYAKDHDDVMDVFAHVCDALRANDLRRLRSWMDPPDHHARFSTWLVTVVHHLAVDWYRHRDGRRRVSTVIATLAPLERSIFECVFLDGLSHVEAYECIRSRSAGDLTFREFQAALRSTYQRVAAWRGAVFRDLGGPPPPEEPAEDTTYLDDDHGRALLDQAMATLSVEDRVAVQLYVVEEMPADAVARTLGWPNAKTAYNRVYRALAVIRGWFEKAGLDRKHL